MNYIEKKAVQLVERRLKNKVISDPNQILKTVQEDLESIESETDKLSYLTIVLEANDISYSKHLKECRQGESCPTNEKYEKVNYFLQQELRILGIQTNSDTFLHQEKESLTNYLDTILADLNNLKDGQKVIYDDLMAEMQELKKWFIIGKKNWRQMAVGKFSEMVAGGIISEATAKPILDTLKRSVSTLIG